MCGADREEALRGLARLENLTRPSAETASS